MNSSLSLAILPSGLYFRTETGGRILLGKSMPEDPVGFDFSWDDKRFMEILWPELAEFVPAFDTLKLLRGWAGLYAVNTLDGNAIPHYLLELLKNRVIFDKFVKIERIACYRLCFNLNTFIMCFNSILHYFT